MNREIELGIIGIMLAFPETVPQVLAELSEEDFFDDKAQKLFTAMRTLHEQGNVIDAAIACQKAGQECRGYAIEATEFPSRRSNLDALISLAIAERRRIKALDIVATMRENLIFGVDLGEVQADVARLMDMLTDSSESDELGARKGRIDFIQRMGSPVNYIRTGFASLDKSLSVDIGDYVIIGGRPSSGKTAFALNLAAHIARTQNVVFFSLETSPEKIMDRLLTGVYGLDFTRVKKHDLDESAMQMLVADASLADNLRFTVVMAAGRTTSWIQSKAQKLKADVIFIDYLGLINAREKKRYEAVTQISVDLHTMAQRTKMTVFALCQLNRGDGEDKAPTMRNLRESGQIEQDADAILFIHKGDRADRRNILLAKNKDGTTGHKELAFDGNKQRFSELAEFEEAPGKWPGKD